MHGTKQECALAIVAELIRVKNFACLGECCVCVHAGLVVVVSRGCVRAIARRSLQRRASNSQWLAPGLGLGACLGLLHAGAALGLLRTSLLRNSWRGNGGMAGTQGIRAGSRVAASGDPVGIGVISASELKGRGRGPGSWSGEFELGSARNGAVSGMVLVTEECVVGVRKVSSLVGGQVTSHAPMKVSNCGCVPAVAVAGEGLVSWAIRDAPLRWVRLIVRHCTPWSDFGRSEGHPGGPPLQRRGRRDEAPWVCTSADVSFFCCTSI